VTLTQKVKVLGLAGGMVWARGHHIDGKRSWLRALRGALSE
jgi:hypothetical protein